MHMSAYPQENNRPQKCDDDTEERKKHESMKNGEGQSVGARSFRAGKVIISC